MVESLETGMRIPKAKIKIGTAFHSDLLDFILPAFDLMLEDCPKAIKPIYKVQRSRWIFPHNGAEIKLVGLDRKPNGLRGNLSDLIIIEEAAFIKKLLYIYRSILVPLTTHRPTCKILLLSSSATDDESEFNTLVQKAELEGGYCKFTIYDNPMLGPPDHARLAYECGGVDSSTWKREYLCESVADSNLKIIPDWDDKYFKFVPRDTFYPFYHKYVSMDLGVKQDHTAVIFGYYDFLKATLVIEDEFQMGGPEMTSEALKNKVTDKEKHLWKEQIPYKRISDNNNPLLLQDFSLMHKLFFHATDKGRLAEMVNQLRMLVSQGRILIQPNCKLTRGCLAYGIWEKKQRREQFGRSEFYGHFDALAALIYLVRNVDFHTNPIPSHFGKNLSNQILFNSNSTSDSIRALRNNITRQ